MFRRITLLVPLLLTSTLSGCIMHPDHGDRGGHNDHRSYDSDHGHRHGNHRR